jgi:hypothetical protein
MTPPASWPSAHIGQGVTVGTQRVAPGVQPGERVLHHVLGGGLVSHQHQREPDKLSVMLAEDQGGVRRRW